jgi:hypothetical protein
MRVPAIKNLSVSVYKTFTRFPFAVLCAIVGTVIAVILLDVSYNEKILQSQYWKAIMTMYLGMLAGICCTVFCEKYYFRPVTQYIFNFLILLLMHYYYYTLPIELQEKEIGRFIVLALTAHLALAFTPFLVDNEPNGFWQYNKQLFLRILTASFYSHVLYLGLALALAAVENLFNVPVEDKNYGKLYIILVGIFNTVFFLAGVPEDIRSLENNNDYPKGLKIFTQFVLLPLIFLYLGILYAYAGKIIVTREWPAGWVSWLINGYAIAGILAFLLVWPLRHNENNQWIKTYSKFFYVTLLPLIVLLFLAIGVRVDEYGITEQRYFIIVTAIWLAVMALYFIFSKIKNIKTIPLTLCIICIIAAYGPISAYEISEDSQYNRLIKLLQKNGMLNENHKVVRSKKTLSFYDKKEMSSTVDYLVSMHGVHSIQHLYTTNLDSLTDSKYVGDYVFKAGKITELMGFDFTYGKPESAEVPEEMYFSAANEETVMISGYDFMILFTMNSQPADSKHRKFAVGDKELNIELKSNTSFTFTYDKDSVICDLVPLIEKLRNDYNESYRSVPLERMAFDLKGSNYHYHLQIKDLNVKKANDKKSYEFYYLEGYVLVRGKEF